MRKLKLKLLFEELVFDLKLDPLLRLRHHTVERYVGNEKQRSPDDKQPHKFLLAVHGYVKLYRRQAYRLRQRQRAEYEHLLIGKIVF